MFNRILIANRGEIACRIIKTAKQQGVHCIAVYSEADANAQHVKMADEAYLLGPAQSSESYLLHDKILRIAKHCNAQAVHPGYGFLSENAEFAQACEDNGIVFIGPPAAAIAAMGSKSAAKEIMSKADVPLVPGYHGDDQNPVLLKEQAVICGFPLLLKAVAGGGGKGMRVVESLDEFDHALAAAQREAKNSFANSDMLLERYLPTTRHIEVQVFCDSQGNGVYLSQRDCSIQRRHQKIVEEAPAPGIPDEVVKAMGEAALNAAKAINYEGAGTVEFLYNQDQSFYFMEMNTRLQVEHPVTEMITNVDLVKWQLEIASGQALPVTQEQVLVNGHAIECRIYAEDPNHDFLPATGVLNYLRTPEQNQQLRVDTGVVEGDEVSVFYDPMISKLIVWGENRQQAVAKMRAALEEYRIVGIKNNIPFLHKVIASDAFSNRPIDTQFIDKNQQVLFDTSCDEFENLAVASCACILRQAQVSNTNSHSTPFAVNTRQWRLNQHSCRYMQWLANDLTETAENTQVKVEDLAVNLVEGSSDNHFVVTVTRDEQTQVFNIIATLVDDKLTVSIAQGDTSKLLKMHVYIDKLQVSLFHLGNRFQYQQPDLSAPGDEGHTEGGLSAPMNGRVIAVLTNVGDVVKAGTPLIVIEAMKMEHSITALEDGQIDDVFYRESDLVSEGDILIGMTASEEDAGS
jgi:3-methylcrotonyl-CoA carboxylase alpha subunit